MEGVAKNLRSHDEGAVARGISIARSALIWTPRPEEQSEAGGPPVEASYAAQRAFGNMTLIQEVTRGMWGWA